MPDAPPVLPWADVDALASRPDTVVWASPRARRALESAWPTATWLDAAGPAAAAAPAASTPIATVIAIGAGAFLDRVKLGWRERAPDAALVAVPTLWGSGAEASPVAVWTEGGKKQFRLDQALRPTAVAYHPGFAATVSPDQARAACGDVWAHAVEGFLSPLAGDALRTELAALIGELLVLPPASDARWFEVGGRAAALQARASVGLVHGLAHVLEPALARPDLGHARLCALFLAPVLRWSARTSGVWRELTERFGVDATAVEVMAARLSEPTVLTSLAPAVEAHWRAVLRDPCTRTSSVLVRPDSLAALTAAMAPAAGGPS